MVRGDRNYPDVYFGRPGALVKLPYPRGEMDKPYQRAAFDFETGAGEHIVSSMASGSRLYTVNWNALHVDNYAKIEQYWTGMMGQGPWVFIDPSMTNMLLPNQASATSLYGDARHFSASNGELSTNLITAYVHRPGSLKSLRWLWSGAAATTPVLSMKYPYRSWFGVPVVPGLSYAWSSWIRPDNVVDSSITVEMKLDWYGPTGSFISGVTGGLVATTGWLRHSTVGVAPAGAAYARPTWSVTGSTVTAGGSLYIDEPLLEQDTVVNDWAPGVGLRAVEILDFADIATFNARFRRAATLTLRELAS